MNYFELCKINIIFAVHKINQFENIMKKKSYYILSISMCFFFYVSCSFNSSRNKESEDKGLYVINLDSIGFSEHPFLYSTIYKNIKTIFLETNDSSLIGGISKIRACDQHIYILDNRIAKSLLVFDMNGRFIRRIGAVGGGPGEFVEPSDFTIDTKNKTIFILDEPSQRINKYSLVSGGFINSINLDRNAKSYHIECAGGKLYADAYFFKHSKDNYLLRGISEPSGTDDGRYLNVMKYNKGLSRTNIIENNPFYLQENGNVVFVQQFMDHIIEINSDKVFPLFTIKSKDVFSSKDLKEIEELSKNVITGPLEIDGKIWKSGKYHSISDFIEHKNLVMFTCMNGGYFFNILFDKLTNETNKFANWKDDLLLRKQGDDYPSFHSDIHVGCYGSNGVYYYYYTGSEYLAEIKKMAQENALSLDLDQLDKLKKLDDNANPIIFYYEFK